MAENANNEQLREWLGQVVATTVELAAPFGGLRVLTHGAPHVPELLAKMLITASKLSELSYMIWTTLNIAGDALQYLTSQFRVEPSVSTLTQVIEEAVSSGELRVHQGPPAGVGEDGTLNMEYWIIPGE